MQTIQVFNPAETAERLAEMEFRTLADFNAGGAGVFWSEAGDTSPWEMHPDCDELLYVLAGEINLEVLPADGGPGLQQEISAGSMVVIPQGCWHRQRILQRTQEFYLTPGPSRHSSSADPRLD